MLKRNNLLSCLCFACLESTGSQSAFAMLKKPNGLSKLLTLLTSWLNS